MITKVSELLAFFIAEETKKVKGMPMPHMPTLGDAYEEITKQGIDSIFVIPANLDLRVVKGFVRVAGVQLPNQIDCMLVVGDGTQFGLTDKYIYEIEQVLCIFEVKKTLTKADFKDALEHLGEIRRAFCEDFVSQKDSYYDTLDITQARKSFSQITGTYAPQRVTAVGSLTPTEAVLFHTLIQEQFAPVMIIHGYEGYSTEAGLRKAFSDILEERWKISGQGLGVTSLPSLVTAGDFCLIKGNGQPYLPTKTDRSWVMLSSTKLNAVQIILELVWTKISHYCGVKMPFGSDIKFESLASLMVAKPVQSGDIFGWDFHIDFFKEKTLKARVAHIDWSPHLLGAPETTLIQIMMQRNGEVSNDKELDRCLINEYQLTFGEIAQRLLDTTYFVMKGDAIRPLAAHTLVLPNEVDETAYVALDKNRFDEWCKLRNRAPHYINFMMIDELIGAID